MFINETATAAKKAFLFLALTLSCAAIVSCHSLTSKRGAGTVDGGGTAALDASPEGASTVAPPLSVTVADLAAAGLSVFADASQAGPMIPATTAIDPSPFHVLLDQADAMTREVAARQGMLGSDIDGLIVVAADLPPASYFLAGYVSAAGTPGAALARRVMGAQDWAHAPAVIYPSLVFALFAADAARYGNALAGAQTTGTAAQPFSLPPGLCSDVKNFIDGTISGFFDALGHLEAPKIPSSGIGIIDWFGSGLQAALDLSASVINGVIDAGRFVVVQGVKAATQPLLDAIATVAGPIGVAVEIVNVLRPWTMQMDAEPEQTDKGVDPGPGAPGRLTGTVTLPGGLDEWPAFIVDCAKVAGVTLPPLKPVGAPITWRVAQNPDALIVQTAGAPVVLDDKASASIAYVTTTESATAARGTRLEGRVKAEIIVRRKEIADLQKTVADAVFAQIPGLIRPIVESVLRPSVTAVLALPPTLLDTHGYESLVVNYHECQSGDCCPPGRVACGTICVDTSRDPANCGGCGATCPSGHPCEGGVCTPSPPLNVCVPTCPAGQTCQSGSCVKATTVASCSSSNSDARFCEDYTGVNWTVATTKQSCVGVSSTWSPNPCPTAERVGSCLFTVAAVPHDLSYIERFYPGPATTFCSACVSDTDCANSFDPMGPSNPTHPCVSGCCDLRETTADAAISCGCAVAGDPGCPDWTPN